jgi:Fe-S cluster biogenesis protein NfuA
MSAQSELEALSASIEEQARIVETCADPATRSAALDLVRSVMELHKSALERLLAIAQKNDGMLDEFARDPAVNSILMLHDLHPYRLQARVECALDELNRNLQRHRAEAKLLGIADGVVRVRLEAPAGCGSDPAALESLIRNALTDAAPDAVEIQIEAPPGQNFVPLAAIQPAQVAAGTNK